VKEFIWDIDLANWTAGNQFTTGPIVSSILIEEKVLWVFGEGL
jgi:hypothetical protein